MSLRLSPVCHAIALMLAAGASMHVHAATNLANIGAQMNAARNAAAGRGVNLGVGVSQQQALQASQPSIQNLAHAAQGIAAQMAAQHAAAVAAMNAASNVPNGLTPGGLQAAPGVNGNTSNPALWINANAPTQSIDGSGHVNVDVKQTAQKAVLTWQTMNVGRQTTLNFDQSGGTQSSGANNWVVFNRIQDPSGAPSQILGNVTAQGSVYVINRNGIIFGAGSQVNVHSLLASSLDLFSSDVVTSNSRFLNGGISDLQSATYGFLTTDGVLADIGQYGNVEIDQGALITTGAQGFALVAAPNVSNAGSIVADDGQAIVAAGVQFMNAAGSDSGGGLQVYEGQFSVGGSAANAPPGGTVTNTGLIQARRGSVHMLGYNVDQAGVVLASTSISYPGSIELNAQDEGTGSTAFGRDGALTLASGSVTAVLPEKDGATTTSSQAANAAFGPSSLTLAGNSVNFQSGSLLEAPNAKLSITAQVQNAGSAIDPRPDAGRIYVDNGAVIDVSGLADVELPMSALLVTIPRIGQNELADSPLLRDSFLYTQQNLVIDSTQSGTRADGLDWIGSPILNVSGYVQNMPRDISQMMTAGGSITLNGQQVIVRDGAQLNLNGGYIAYQPGWVTTPNLLGADGHIYSINNANPDIDYVGFAGQFTETHSRWGVTKTWYDPLVSGFRRWDDGFIVGGDAGTLSIKAGQALVLDGAITAQSLAGRNQIIQGNQPAGGTLDISSASYITPDNKNTELGLLVQQSSLALGELDPGFQADAPWSDVLAAQDATATPDDDLRQWLPVPADMIAQGGFQTVTLDTRVFDSSNVFRSSAPIQEQAGTDVTVQPGGAINLNGSRIAVMGRLNAPSGSITLATDGSASYQENAGSQASNPGDITIGGSAVLSVDGLWVNDSNGTSTDVMAGDRYIDGGRISLATEQSERTGGQDNTGSIFLQPGSLLDASGGGYIGADGQIQSTSGVPDGRGGDISLVTYENPPGSQGGGFASARPAALDSGRLELGGTLRAYGFSGGGTLTLQAAQIQIGGDPSDMAEANGLYLDPSFFAGQGFDNYVLTSMTDAGVAAGTTIHVTRDNLLPDYAALLSAPTGTDLYATDAAHPRGIYATLGQLDSYLRYATRDTTAGHGPGFSLDAGSYLDWIRTGTSAVPQYPGVSGTLTLGEGAVVVTDAGGAVSLMSKGSATVLGAVHAPGGSITVAGGDGLTSGVGTLGRDASLEVWLGSQAVLDASGVSLIDPLALPARGSSGVGMTPRTGTVLAGGSVALSNADGYVLAAPGSVIDVSGASDIYDLPGAATGRFGSGGYVATPVWSDAGSITLEAASGLYVDSTLRAQAGAPQAEGGSLTIAGLSPSAAGGNTATGIVLQQSGDLLPAGFQPGQAPEAGKPSGVLHFAVDRLDGSGITSLAIGPDPSVTNGLTGNQIIVPLGFAGDVDLNLGRSFTANASAYIALAPGNKSLATTTGGYAQGNGTVSISAPYVNLSSAAGNGSAPVARAGDGVLKVNADFIDLGGWLDLQQFADADFTSSGDLRFYQSPTFAYQNGAMQSGLLFTTGNLTFQAAQLYPATDYAFVIDANPSGLKDASENALSTTVTILPNGTSAVPLSAGGALLVDADNIEQDGTIRVPSGNLVLGVQDPVADANAFGLASTTAFPLVATQSVHLASGSITSVSLDGATIPFGTTTDGTDWTYSGDPLNSSPDLATPPAKQLHINGTNVSLDAGAAVDLSGGGNLQAEEWVNGTGGTRDVLSQTETDYTNSTSGVSVPQYADGRAIYAVVPGYSAPVSAHDAALEKGAGDGPAVGQAVYLSGVPGLPAGVYTLLPAKYATLKGAYRVVQNTVQGNAVPGASMTLTDGTVIASGYFADALTGARGQETSFQVQSGPVWQQYSQYTISDANTYFAKQASQAGTVAPQLPQDAGHLILAAGQQLALGTTLTAAPATGGRGSEVDIAAQAIQVVGGNEAARDGYLQLSADGLTTLGAGSLLLGGTRSVDADGDLVDTIATGVVISNDSTHPLAGQEILLAANGDGSANAPGIVVEGDSDIEARGNPTGAGSQTLTFGSNATTDANGNPVVAVSGNGALLRVSQNGTAPVMRNDTDGASGNLTVGAGATIDGGSALTLDATGSMQVDPLATFSAQAIDADANLVTFAGAGSAVDGQTSGLVIGPNTLNLFRNAQTVTLRSRGDMNFAGDVTVDLPNALELDAGTFVSDGGRVGLQAGTLALGNALGAASSGSAAGGGQLALSANEIDFRAGNATLRGFGGVSATAAQGMTGQGSGGIDFGSLDVNLTTPIFIADSGASTRLTTTGALSIANNGGKPLTGDALGGSLSLVGGTVNVGTDLEAPAGNLTLEATAGDLTVANGAKLDTAGVNKTFFDAEAYAAGGTLELLADQGAITVGQGASLAFGGAVNGGDAGTLDISAGGNVVLDGSIDGRALDGYHGGYFLMKSGGSVDLDAIASLTASAGTTGAISVTSGQGNLDLSAGSTLKAGNIYLEASGGSGQPGASDGNVQINGVVDISGQAAGQMSFYGRSGVDIEGKLLATSSIPEQRGGTISIGTSGFTDGTLNSQYGYENVQAGGSGAIRIGKSALIDVSGGSDDAFSGGSVSFRAPLLANGDINITIDGAADIKGARVVTIEPYAVWSTADASAGAQHFDGIIDPAGWYRADGSMVAGTWADAKGNVLAAPADEATLKVYLAEDYFIPDAANPDHTGFYAYAGGDPDNGPGTLMGFIQQPGFSFGSRFADIANIAVRPGIELDNPGDAVNGGDIAVLTNWNLGAGITGPDGGVTLAYRYNGNAPVLTVRAAHNLNVEASITDGFYQRNDGAYLQDPVVPPSSGSDDVAYGVAVGNYQSAEDLYDQFGLQNSRIVLADGSTADLSTDPYYQPLMAPLAGQTTAYYTNYEGYLGEANTWVSIANVFDGFLPLAYKPISTRPDLNTAPNPANFSSYSDYSNAYFTWLGNFVAAGDYSVTPSPILLPVQGSDYSKYSGDYSSYLSGHQNYMYSVFGVVVDPTSFGWQWIYAPLAPGASTPPDPAYTTALGNYKTTQTLYDQFGLQNSRITLADGSAADLSADPYYQPLMAPHTGQTAAYYTNYEGYLGEANTWVSIANVFDGFLPLAYNPISTRPDLNTAPNPANFSSYSDYSNAYFTWLGNFVAAGDYSVTPSPILLPVQGSDYSKYSSDYSSYLSGHQNYMYSVFGVVVDPNSFGWQWIYAPLAPADNPFSSGGSQVAVPSRAADNSPSNGPRLGSPVSLASATLLGGSSTSYRLVAGADMAATDPLGVLASPAATAGNVNLGGHFSIEDTATTDADGNTINQPGSAAANKTLLLPTTIRTGSGSIDIAAAGDIDWQDSAAPAAIYAAGEPTPGSTTGTGVTVARPTEGLNGVNTGSTLPDMLVTDPVNPYNGGDVSLNAQGSINGIEQVIDADGSVTKGNKGAFIGQFWWAWMETGNAVDGSSSSINFANFDQGVMSVGGNVRITAGADIRDLSVSLPTTWYANADGQTVSTAGGGNLVVQAGQDILSGSYFVARGTGSITAGGQVGSDFSYMVPASVNDYGSLTTPVSTLLAMQDAQVTVSARQGVDLGGVYDPSYFSLGGVSDVSQILPAGHFDAQGYSAASRLDVAAVNGNVTLDSLSVPAVLFDYGGTAVRGSVPLVNPGAVLPATVSMVALNGDLDILGAGSLYPSATGNLTLLADGSIGFSQQVYTMTPPSGTAAMMNFGLIDAPASILPSPLDPSGAGVTSSQFGGMVAQGYIDASDGQPGSPESSLLHGADPLHGDDDQPVRIYALNGDITDGIDAPSGFQFRSLDIVPDKSALVYAGNDIVNLSFLGQQTHDADITRISAGHDIYDTALPSVRTAFASGGYELVPSLLLGGPGSFLIEAGHDIGPLANQTEIAVNNQFTPGTLTGIDTIGNLGNPYLPHQGADANVLFGVGPGTETAAFVTAYLDPTGGVDGFGSLVPDLVTFMEQREAGTVVDTGYQQDKVTVTLSADQARTDFNQLPEYVQRLFVEQELFKVLSTVGADYNDPSSAYFHQYARGYAALDTLFPASLGYTDNGAGAGGLNGAAQTVDTGDLDIRSSTIQTQQGGNVTILGPGGQALVGSASAPPVITNGGGQVVAGPNSMGILTQEQGDVNIFIDRSVLLAQSRIFTEQGGDMTIWSSNGDINAGQGAKTTSETPSPSYLCTVDAWCLVDAKGEVSGAGIGTLQTIPGAPVGSVYLVAPRGTVDAGDAGIRVSGNLYVAAAQVLNADNIQVQGKSTGVPVVASVDTGALTAATSAASAATQMAQNLVRNNASGVPQRHWTITVQVEGFGDAGGDNNDDSRKKHRPASLSYNASSSILVLGFGGLEDAQRAYLTDKERSKLGGI